MLITGIEPETGEEIEVQVPDANAAGLSELRTLGLNSRQLKTKIETIDISADAKVILFKIASTVLKVGETVVKIGQKIIEVVFDILSRFPNTTFGLVLGAVAGLLVSSVPIIGLVLGPLFSPILLLLGISLGAKTDFIEKAMEARIKASLEPFSPLKA